MDTNARQGKGITFPIPCLHPTRSARNEVVYQVAKKDYRLSTRLPIRTNFPLIRPFPPLHQSCAKGAKQRITNLTPPASFFNGVQCVLKVSLPLIIIDRRVARFTSADIARPILREVLIRDLKSFVIDVE